MLVPRQTASPAVMMALHMTIRMAAIQAMPATRATAGGLSCPGAIGLFRTSRKNVVSLRATRRNSSPM